MYLLNVETHAGLKKSLCVSFEAEQFLTTKGIGVSMTPRKKLIANLQDLLIAEELRISDELANVHNFLSEILKESSSEFFTIQFEAIPAHPKINPIFKDPNQIPKEQRDVTVIFKDKEIMSGVDYCTKCEAWHTSRGDIKVHKIHQWAYSDELYPQLNLPEITEETKTENERINDEMPKELLKMFLLAALLSGKKSKSDFRNSPFNI
ncbi:hypothetical protein [Acinetobacter guillouiae]|uniref:hypothetical protein n=1 Tax=Acinetobacter guillouiae TaxID=106649 RepID=UPI00125EBE0D|nr:hypothetical protein [Acinetobacter guillouiae]